jgi:hypothetical protein
MVADGLTKPLPAPAFNKFRTMLNLSSWLVEEGANKAISQ